VVINKKKGTLGVIKEAVPVSHDLDTAVVTESARKDQSSGGGSKKIDSLGERTRVERSSKLYYRERETLTKKREGNHKLSSTEKRGVRYKIREGVRTRECGKMKVNWKKRNITPHQRHRARDRYCRQRSSRPRRGRGVNGQSGKKDAKKGKKDTGAANAKACATRQ